MGYTDVVHVVVPIFNPAGYQSRYRLYRAFEKHMLSNERVHLVTVEVAFGNEPFHVTEKGNPDHVQLRTNHEIWVKENAINVGISRLPIDYKYVAWIDGDIEFLSSWWAEETIERLKLHKIVQMFQYAKDLGPTGQVIQKHTSFGYLYRMGAYPNHGGKSPYTFWHPGFAWAARKDAIDEMGGLLDWSILGSADHHMALAWVGKAANSFPKGVTQEYKNKIMLYQKRCEKYIKRDIGYVWGTILHNWHGSKKNRFYRERWSILVDNKFNPETHIKKDSHGLYQLESDQIGLKNDIHNYFLARKEDSEEM